MTFERHAPASGEAAAPRAEADADAIVERCAVEAESFPYSVHAGKKCETAQHVAMRLRALKGTLKLPGEQPGYTDNKALNERLAAENKRLRELATEILRVNQYAERYPITKAEGWRVLVDMTLAALKPEATKERK